MRLSDRNLAIAAIDTDYFRDVRKVVTFGIAGHAAIVDQAGKVLAHPRDDWRLEMKDLRGVEPVDRMVAGSTGVSVFYSPALDAEFVGGYSTVKGAGWGTIIPQPLTELEASARKAQAIVLSILLFGALVTAGFSQWLTGYLTRPVIAVTHAATRKDDIVARLGGDELGIVLIRYSMAEAMWVTTAVRDAISEDLISSPDGSSG